MDATGDGDITRNATDASNDFSNDLYVKLDSDISFEDALKNSTANTEQEMPYLDIQSPQFDKETLSSSQRDDSAENYGEINNVNGAATFSTSQKVDSTITVENSKEAVSAVPDLTETEETEALVDEFLGETNQALDENIEPETEERLLADSEEEITLPALQLSVNESNESISKESEPDEFEESKLRKENSEEDKAEPDLVEEVAMEDTKLPQDQAETVEEVQYVVEEPSNSSNEAESVSEQNVEIRETEAIMIEEISTDGSISSVGNPPIIIAPEEKELDQKAEENTVLEVVEKIQEIETVAVEENEIAAKEVQNETTMKTNDVTNSDRQNPSNETIDLETAEVVLLEEMSEIGQIEEPSKEEKSKIEKQIEEASIVIDMGKSETEKQIQSPEQQESETVQESIIIIEETELVAANDKKEKSEQQQKIKEKQKKPTNLEKIKIPHHVLGTNIEKPVRDLCSNGRVPPKPRLGVKIPYRNLTSQIVSKQEIEQVILDRARAKQQQPPVGGDLFFTKKLTQRLARKIIPEEKKKMAEMELQKKKQLEVEEKKKSEEQGSSSGKPAQDADLLAILEGDADDIGDVSGESNKSKDVAAEIREWEREVALKQLEQMPPRRRGRSGGLDQAHSKPSTTKTAISDSSKCLKIPTNKPSSIPVVQKMSTEEKPKENTQKLDNSEDEVDIEPRFSTNSVVKTYTRKRKPTETLNVLAKEMDVDISPKKPLKAVNEQKEQKVSIDLPPNAYVTKSSRVIKRKVIWDPDEAASPIRSYKSAKTETPLKQEKAVSPPKSAEKKSAKIVTKTPEEKPKSAQKATEEKQKIVQKVTEKSPQKRVDKEKAALLKKPKRLTEVDRLLMDEGAVNMIYDVKSTEDQGQVKQKKRNLSTISLDKAQKELLNKTNEIKNDLQINSSKESPKSLRKKDGTSITPPQVGKKEIIQPGQITRKKSKDSNRSSVHSPPASPAYVFPQHAEASRIIRRHSSSSFSSGDEAQQKELDKDESYPAKVVKKKGSTEQKTVKKFKAEKESLSGSEKSKLNEEMSKSFNELTEKNDVKPAKYGEFKTLSVKTEANMVHVTMNVGRKDALLNVSVLNELTVILNQIKNDSACNAVLLTSLHKSFCQGLDYKALLADTEEQRKKKATNLANAVKEFLQTLAAFPKFIAAAVQGSAIGLGVTMLPLFDMVLAKDKATFSTPYCRLGCAAEGGSLLNLPHVASNSLASELLYASQKIVAGDAVKRGLVTRIIREDKFQEDVLNTIKAISSQSQQALETVKKQLRQPFLDSINSNTSADVEILVQQWISAECQKNFGKYRLEKE